MMCSSPSLLLLLFYGAGWARHISFRAWVRVQREGGKEKERMAPNPPRGQGDGPFGLS